MDDKQWRFPGNGYGSRMGLSDSNSELFKGDILAGLAREMVQNSIDAKLSDDVCARVEFNCFDVPRDAVPGIDDVEKRIDDAIDTYKELEGETIDTLQRMKDSIHQNIIHCCRISDFNTKGACGVFDSNQSEATPWNLLTKGSGLSNKTSTSGGSKGVGKYASYANSEFGMVFCSTSTIDGDEGYMGIVKLCSAKQDGTDELTQGFGFYANDIKHTAIPGQFNLDPTFERKETGTDVYIIGFIQHENWEQEVISKLLDSFISAVFLGFLELKVGQYIINRDNLREYIFNPDIINPKNGDGRSVTSQYYLFTKTDGPHIIRVGNYGEVALYVLDCTNQYEDCKTNGCIMIRYPYMKIQVSPIDSINWPYAAMCIIQNNELNELLRSAENPQHRNWEPKRLNSQPEKKERLTKAYDELLNKIAECIRETLFITNEKPSNLIGAEEYIPLDDGGADSGVPIDVPLNKNKNLNLKPTLSKHKRKIVDVSTSAEIPDEEGYGAELYFGNGEESDDNILSAESLNGEGGGQLRPGDDIENKSISDDGKIVMKPAQLRSMKYHFVCLNKNRGEFAIMFTSDYDVSYATIEVYEVDENNAIEKISIFSAVVNGEAVAPEDNFYSIPLSLKRGERFTIIFQTDKDELFSAEVKTYARG